RNARYHLDLAPGPCRTPPRAIIPQLSRVRPSLTPPFAQEREPCSSLAGYVAMSTIELGLDTFGDVTADADGRLLPHAQVLRNVVAEAELADGLGVDFFRVGEHHRPDFAISAPEALLAAIATKTRRIRLGTAVTILSTDDPVRVYQRFSTLDAVSNGRAEVILGR